jgi:hypothetical protein
MSNGRTEAKALNRSDFGAFQTISRDFITVSLHLAAGIGYLDLGAEAALRIPVREGGRKDEVVPIQQYPPAKATDFERE